MHGIGSLPDLYLRREVKWRFAWDDIPYTKLSVWPVAGITQGAVSSLRLSSALLWCYWRKTETRFQPWSKLFCCFTIRIGHHENTLNPNWKWNVFWKAFSLKLQGNYWKQSRAHDAYCRDKSLYRVLVHCNGWIITFLAQRMITKRHQASAPTSVMVERLRDFSWH